MYKETINSITIKVTHDLRYPRQNGCYPVRIQVTSRRVQKYYNTGKEITKDEWERLISTRVPELVKIRNQVKKSFDLIVNSIEELASKGEFTFENLNIRLGRASGGTVNDAFRAKITNLEAEGRVGSMSYYSGILSSIGKFAGNNIVFESITVDWLKRYEAFLVKTGITYATIGMRMRGIRAIINIAKKDGVIKESTYPFGKDKYEIKTGEARKRALSLEQIAQIANFSDGNETTSRYRDIWLFIYLCNGINTADLVNLKFRDIVDDEIYFVREKTKRTTKVIKEIRVIITSEMKDIITRWGNSPDPNNYIFPLIHRYSDPIKHAKEVKDLVKRINKRTKKIGKALGIGTITTYTARHSFATVLKRSGANIAFISESLGHSDLKTTESYLASFEKEERIKNANILTRFNRLNE